MPYYLEYCLPINQHFEDYYDVEKGSPFTQEDERIAHEYMIKKAKHEKYTNAFLLKKTDNVAQRNPSYNKIIPMNYISKRMKKAIMTYKELTKMIEEKTEVPNSQLITDFCLQELLERLKKDCDCAWGNSEFSIDRSIFSCDITSKEESKEPCFTLNYNIMTNNFYLNK